MFAIVAAVFFFLAAFKVTISDVNLVYLALAFLALHFAWDIALPVYRRPNA